MLIILHELTPTLSPSLNFYTNCHVQDNPVNYTVKKLLKIWRSNTANTNFFLKFIAYAMYTAGYKFFFMLFHATKKSLWGRCVQARTSARIFLFICYSSSLILTLFKLKSTEKSMSNETYYADIYTQFQ